MKYSKTTHFWAWFKNHHQTYALLPKESRKAGTYWLRELYMHLAAYGKHVHVDIFWGNDTPGDVHTIIFTTKGRSNYFRKVEFLVSKAPVIPGWKFVALQPPRPADFFIQEDFGDVNMNPFELFFIFPKKRDSKDRVWLTVCGEFYGEVTGRLREAVQSVVYNTVGEKIYGLGIYAIEVKSFFELTVHERDQLFPLDCLQGFFAPDDIAGFVVNVQGVMEERK